MAYTLKQIYETLSKLENGGEMVADLRDAISSLNNEAAQRRTERNHILEQLGLRDGGDVDGGLRSIVASLNALKTAGNDPNQLGEQFKDLQGKFEELKNKYDAAEKKAQEEHSKRVRTSVDTEVINALTKGKAINPEAMLKVVRDNISIGDDDSAAFVDGDKHLSIEEGVSGWLKANPWAVKADVQGGAGGGTGGAGSAKRYSMEDLSKMSPAEINSHWDEISKGVDK